MKKTNSLESWLRQKAKNGARGKILGAPGLLALAALVFFISFWVVYLVVFMGFNWILPQSHETRLWISGGILILLVIGNATTDRRYLESFSFFLHHRHQKPQAGLPTGGV